MILVLRILLAVLGGLFLILDFRAYVCQRLNETMGLLWAGVSIVLLLAGIIPFSTGHGYDAAVLLLFLVCFLLLLLLFKLSKMVSVLMMKNQELAMQVSLLNQENERILHEIGILTDEKNTVRD